MNSTQQLTNLLPESLLPCANIRRSYSHLMKDEPCFTYDTPKQQAKGHTNNNAAGAVSCGIRSVVLDSKAMNDLADKISQSIQNKHKCNNNNNNNHDNSNER